MPIFVYRAKDKTKTVTGEIEGVSEDAVIAQLERKGLLPIRVSPKTQSSAPQAAPATGRPAPSPPAARFKFFGNKIKARDLNAYTRQFAGLVKSKTPMLRTLEILARETRHPALRAVSARIRDRVKDGASLSDTMKEHACFSKVYVSLVAAGEKSGLLEQMLTGLVQRSDKEEEAASKFRSAMAYPILMAFVGIGTVVVMIVFVVPRLVGLYANIGQTLPLSTRVLLGISDFLRKGWPFIAVFSALTVYAVRKSRVLVKKRVVLSRIALKLPAAGPYLLEKSVFRFCGTLGLLIGSGVEIRDAISAAVPTTGNASIEHDLRGLSADVAGGTSFSVALKKVPVFPSYAVSLISVGEEAGRLHESLADTAAAYERESDEKLRVFSALLEPVMILLIGLVVGFIVYSMLMPIFEFNLS